MTEKTWVTQSQFEALQSEFEERSKVRRPHIANLIEAARMEGARAGAIGGSPALAAERTKDLMTSTLAESYASNITAHATETGIEVIVRAPIPGAGFLGDDVIEVRAHANRE